MDASVYEKITKAFDLLKMPDAASEIVIDTGPLIAIVAGCIKTVAIDEATGRRIARLNGLLVTGTIGIILRAKKEGIPFSLNLAIKRMQDKGVRLSRNVIEFAMKHSGI